MADPTTAPPRPDAAARGVRLYDVGLKTRLFATIVIFVVWVAGKASSVAPLRLAAIVAAAFLLLGTSLVMIAGLVRLARTPSLGSARWLFVVAAVAIAAAFFADHAVIHAAFDGSPLAHGAAIHFAGVALGVAGFLAAITGFARVATSIENATISARFIEARNIAFISVGIAAAALVLSSVLQQGGSGAATPIRGAGTVFAILFAIWSIAIVIDALGSLRTALENRPS